MQEKPVQEKPGQEKPGEEKKPVQEKIDLLTLRYKPQAGTLLYDVHTTIDQHVTAGTSQLSGRLNSSAQVAFHNVAIDYKANLWSFDRYFTLFTLSGRQFNGDTLSLKENAATNRVTRLTYQMTGEEIHREVIDTMKLLNTEAQTHFYFFQPPRMLVPLPQHLVKYGDTWSDTRIDTIHVYDTINTGITTGEYIYKVDRIYSLVRLDDTLGQHLAVIVASDTGNFSGEQSNTATGLAIKAHGPISGFDTTYLDLFSGRVVRRTTNMRIPATVEADNTTPFSDALEVRSVVVLNESNALQIKNGEE